MEIVQTMYLDRSKVTKGALSCFWNSSSLRLELRSEVYVPVLMSRVVGSLVELLRILKLKERAL